MLRAPHEKRVIIEFNEPTTETIQASAECVIPKGTLILDRAVTTAALLDILKVVAPLPKVRDIKIEEPDFEEVIRGFIEKESGLH